MARVRGLDAVLARQIGVGDRHAILPENFIEQAGPGNSAPLVRNVYPPWVYKLPTSSDFNANAFNVALAGVIGQQVEVTRFQVPATFVGYLQIMGIYILAPTNAQTVTFTLRINGAPVIGWDNIVFPPGVANFVIQNFADMQVKIPNGALITLTAQNGSADAWTIGGKLAGWYHSEVEENRIYGDL